MFNAYLMLGYAFGCGGVGTNVLLLSCIFILLLLQKNKISNKNVFFLFNLIYPNQDGSHILFHKIFTIQLFNMIAFFHVVYFFFYILFLHFILKFVVS